MWAGKDMPSHPAQTPLCLQGTGQALSTQACGLYSSDHVKSLSYAPSPEVTTRLDP